ncbi:gliding motility-associated lipoprotein GldD [Mariniphaga anaerophila]|uniref:Gliding motility-associated lipoprotein GldD n=1 Tax=Mariniphaga anaerophila TaxID=1484053 RepID=A0A1M4W6V0_9BACT|nr:gliding motility lipoprotein GldD [Mariniphaga anaerophila]SHE76929.1 gliding motility-associated lipoprotein GldD [Mariniphaga anaerophila]
MNYKLLTFIVVLLVAGCKEKHTPRPRGFFRIDLPAKEYHSLSGEYPYQFEVADYTRISPDRQNPEHPSWINLEFPANKAAVHISYYNLQDNQKSPRELLAKFMEETRELAYKHSIKANAIEESIYENPQNKVFGTVYRIEGNAASPMQFFLTDSTQHFLRGALYIRATPDIDSLKPVIRFLEHDVIRLIETTKWK